MTFSVGERGQSGLDFILESIGTGFQKGASAGMQTKLDTMLKAKETDITPQDVAKLGSQFLDKQQMSEIPLEAWQKMSDEANEKKFTEGPKQALFSSFKDYLQPEKEEIPLLTQQQIDERDEEEETKINKYLKSIKKGMERGIGGKTAAVLRGEGLKEFEERTALEDPNFLQRFLAGAGRIGSDIPFFGAGATLGAPLGAPAGPVGAATAATAGAFALPAMLDTALTEYQKYLDRGKEGTFEDFLRGAARTAEAGGMAAAEGVMFKSLGKLIGPLKKIPRFKKLLEMKKGGKALEKVATSAIQTTGILGAEAVARGELPSSQNVADTFAQILGLNLAHINPHLWKNTAKRIQKSGKTTAEVAAEVQERGREKDLNRPSELFKIVSDVTAEPPPMARTIVKIGEEKISKVSPEEEARTRRKEAEAIAKGPLEETLKKEEKKRRKKEKPLTEKEDTKRKIAQQQAAILDKKMAQVQNDVTFIKEKLEKASKKERPLLDVVFESKEKELKELETQKKDLESIAKIGRGAFIRERTEQRARERIGNLEKIAENIESESAETLKRQFEKDQKYIDSLQEMLRNGILPEPEFYDRYIKELSIYQKAYENALKDIQNRIQTTSQPELLSKLKNFEKILKKNLDINTAKIERQKQKRATLQRLKKPGSPMLRHMIADMRKDLPQLQKELMRYKDFTSALEKKTRDIFEKAQKSIERYSDNPSKANLKAAEKATGATEKEIKESVLPKDRIQRIEKLAKLYQENPSTENLQKLAQELNLSPEMVKKFFEKKSLKELENILEGTKDKFEKGEKKGKIAQWFKSEMEDFIKKRIPKMGKGILGGLLMLPIRWASEKAFGYKVPFGLLFFLAPFMKGMRYGAGTVGYVFERLLKKYSLNKQRKEFQSKTTPQSKIKYIGELKKEGLSQSQIKKIIAA